MILSTSSCGISWRATDIDSDGDDDSFWEDAANLTEEAPIKLDDISNNAQTTSPNHHFF
jgi:hypothetical protein